MLEQDSELRHNQTEAEARLWSYLRAHRMDDSERTAFLEARGYRVLRFWNNDVMNDLSGVMKAIDIALSES